MTDALTRVGELLQEGGIRELVAGSKRFLWWQCGGMYVEYTFYSATGRPVIREIAGTSAAFRVGSIGEFKRVKTFSGEAEVIAWFLRQLNPRDVIWDIGANIGSYTLFAAQHADSIISFEPHPANVKRLRENAAINDVKIDIQPIALSNETGTTTLTANRKRAGAGSGQLADNGQYEINVRPGENIDPPPDVIKIDVEGHELAVLEGLGTHLNQVRTVLIEVHDEEDLKEVKKLLRGYGLGVSKQRKIGTREFIVGERRGD